jgi:hypothetical protein
VSAEVRLRDDDVLELTEMLAFLHDWIDYAPDALGEWLARFTGSGYTLDELRADLARFVFVLGGPSDQFVLGEQA